MVEDEGIAEISAELEYFLLHENTLKSTKESERFGPADAFMTLVVLLPIMSKIWEWYSKP